MKSIEENKKEINKEIFINTIHDIKYNKKSISPIRKNFISSIDISKKLKGTGNIKVLKTSRNFSTFKRK
jgi:hypothetical protein